MPQLQERRSGLEHELDLAKKEIERRAVDFLKKLNDVILKNLKGRITI